MPKVKKSKNDENKCPVKKTQQLSKVPFKFDMKKILKEREADSKFWERSAELDEQIKVVDELFQKEVNQIMAYENGYKCPDLPKSGYVIFDSSKYNIIFENNLNSDVTNSYLQRLYTMSIEENHLKATIHFNILKNANWSPGFDDIQNIFINWGTDVDTLLNKSLLKCPINSEGKIKQLNFKLVIQFITESIEKNNHKFSVDDLLTLAKFAATISFDHHYGQLTTKIKRLFSICIETAFHNNDDETAILSFSQEFYSNYKESLMLKMVIDLFLPLEGQIMKKVYTYITFKLYKLFLGKTNNLNAFPSNINDWFIQNQVNQDYFILNPKNILKNLIQLLEHVVVILDLYKDEEKLSYMYDFLHSIVKPDGLSESSQKLINILDQWRLQLFRLHVDRKKMCI